MNDAATPQPPPSPGVGPSVHDLVIEDIRARQDLGIEKYGRTLQAFNGRDSLVDLEQELLDGAAYCRQARYERDALVALLACARRVVASGGTADAVRALEVAVARCGG